MMEHKAFNVTMHVIFMLLVIAGVGAFYLLYAKDIDSSLKVMCAVGIGAGFLILSMVFMLIADCILLYHPGGSLAIRFFATLLSIASVVLVALYFHFNINSFTGLEYWVVALFGLCPVIQGNYRGCNSAACKFYSGVLAAFTPLIAIILAAGFCAGTFYLTNWIVTLHDFGAQGECIWYFWMSIGAGVISNLIFYIVVFLCKVVFNSI